MRGLINAKKEESNHLDTMLSATIKELTSQAQPLTSRSFGQQLDRERFAGGRMVMVRQTLLPH